MKQRRTLIIASGLVVLASAAVYFGTRQPDPAEKIRTQTNALVEAMRAVENEDFAGAADKIKVMTDEVNALKSELAAAGQDRMVHLVRTYHDAGVAERFRLVSPFLILRHADLTLASGFLSPEDRRTFLSAIEEVRALARNKLEFETALSKEDLDLVTAGVPRSTAAAAKRFPPHLQLNPCERAVIDAAAGKLGWRHISEIYLPVVILNELRDMHLVPELFPRLAELARKHPEKRFNMLAEIYADKELWSALQLENLPSRLQEHRAVFEKEGYSSEETDRMLAELLADSPDCFIGLGIDIVSYVSEQTTLMELRALAAMLAASPEDLHKLKSGDETQEILARLLARAPVAGKNRWRAEDSWGTAYEFMQGNSGWHLRSAGPDLVFETEDDLFNVPPDIK